MWQVTYRKQIVALVAIEVIRIIWRAAAALTSSWQKCSGVELAPPKAWADPMHLFAEETPFCGSVPIVAGTVPLAVGAALAAKLDGSPEVGIAYFGDGACEEGIVHESLNLASQMKLPVLFVVENNFYSSHMDIKLRQPSDRTARFADAHLIDTEVVDGNNVVEVANAAGRLIEQARTGKGPGFLECVTYRWRGHVGPDENIDVGIRRIVRRNSKLEEARSHCSPKSFSA